MSRGGRGFVTRGLSDPKDHYYSRLFVDAARAVEATRAIDSVADRPVVVCGGSRAVRSPLPRPVFRQRASVVLADVPFLSDFRRAVAITERHRSQRSGIFRDIPRSGRVRVQDAFLLRRRQPRQKGDGAIAVQCGANG